MAAGSVVILGSGVTVLFFGHVVIGVAALLLGTGFSWAAVTGHDNTHQDAFLDLAPCECCLHATLWPHDEEQACRLCEWDASLRATHEVPLPTGRANFERHGTYFSPERSQEWEGMPLPPDEARAKLDIIRSLQGLYQIGQMGDPVPVDDLRLIDIRLSALAARPGATP